MRIVAQLASTALLQRPPVWRGRAVCQGEHLTVLQQLRLEVPFCKLEKALAQNAAGSKCRRLL